MLLPNADQAIIAPEKLRDYLLSVTHPVGKNKAVFFHALGYQAATWERLTRILENDEANGLQTLTQGLLIARIVADAAREAAPPQEKEKGARA